MLKVLGIVLLCRLIAVASTESLPSPTKIRVTERSMTSFKIEWKQPASQVYENFLVKVSPEASDVKQEETASLSRTFAGLSPGERYTVFIQGFTSEGLSSSVLKYDVWTVPERPSNMSLSAVHEIAISISIMGVKTKFTAFVDGMQVEWSDDSQVKVISGYELEIIPDEGVIVESDDDKFTGTVKRIITGLTPGKEYSVALKSHVGPNYDRVYSAPVVGKMRMPPAVPYSVEIMEMESSSAVLKTHGPLEGIYDDLYFELNPNHGAVGNPSPDPNFPMFDLYPWKGLKPGTSYVLDVYAVSQSVKGYKPKTVTFSTFPDVPMRLRVADFHHRFVTLEWNHAHRFTELDEVQYLIEFFEVPGGKLQFATVKNFKVDNQVVVQVQKLIPGTVYNFQVYTILNGVKGNSPSGVIQTTIPLKPTVASVILLNGRGVRITFGPPLEGKCPSVKVFYSPGSVQPTFHELGEEIFYDDFPVNGRYSIHARCVSENVEGPELVVTPSIAPGTLETNDTKPDARFDEPDTPKRAALPCASLVLAAIPNPDSIAPDACCNSRPYNTEQKECCGSALLAKEGDRLCCQDNYYNKRFALCCDGPEGKFIRSRREGCPIV